MQRNIEIKFLTKSEMKNAKDIDWRYEFVDENNLGFSDKLKRRVYVQAGLDRELTNYLVDHELEHLFELEGSHEDANGIRHKKFFKELVVPILKVVLPIAAAMIPGVGPIASAALAGSTAFGANAIGNTIQTGKPNWSDVFTKTGLSAAGSLGGSALSGAFGSGTGASGALSPTSWVGGSSDIGSGFMPIASAAEIAALNAGGQAAGSGIGQTIGGALGSGLSSLFMGAAGQGQSAQGGYGPASSSQSFRMPDLSQQANANPGFSGWTENVAMPEMPSYFGQSGAEMTDSMGMGGLSKMPTNPGLGQAGIELEGQEMGQGFSNKMMNQMFQGSQDPFGFSNGGSLSF